MISRDMVGVLYNSQRADAKDLACKIVSDLNLGDDTLVYGVEELEKIDANDWLGKVDLFITVGGDGTILRASHMAARNGVAILGVNLGQLGFLTELRAEEAIEKIPGYLDGEVWIEERNMIEARVVTADPGGTQIVYEALNEVAIGRREVAGLSMIGVTVDDEPLTTYRADAVIVSTATGSTGYALSAGGPILHPQSEDILITPVAPHLDKSWALVLPKSARVEVSFLSQQPGALAIDGFIDVPIGYGDTVKIIKGESVARFIRGNPPSHYYAGLVRKLGLDPWEM